MAINESRLRQILREEARRVLREGISPDEAAQSIISDFEDPNDEVQLLDNLAALAAELPDSGRVELEGLGEDAVRETAEMLNDALRGEPDALDAALVHATIEAIRAGFDKMGPGPEARRAVRHFFSNPRLKAMLRRHHGGEIPDADGIYDWMTSSGEFHGFDDGDLADAADYLASM
jgi:hypothetical protein